MKAQLIGVCGYCGAYYTVKKDGTLRSHTNQQAPTGGLPFHPHCEGSASTPIRSGIWNGASFNPTTEETHP